MSLLANVELQLSELDMLLSMFPDKNEIVWDDPFLQDDWRRWLEQNDVDDNHPSPISFRLTLAMDASPSTLTLQTEMPHAYPLGQTLTVYAKSNDLTREAQSRLNRDLQEHLRDGVPHGDLAVGTAVAWIQEHARDYFEQPPIKEEDASASAAAANQIHAFTRLWIYSHHIYSKTKRKNILDLAGDFRLTGFSMPGKPGVVCLEGRARDVQAAWADIKSWNWKKINVRTQEEADEADDAGVDRRRRFDGFEEIGLVKSAETRDYHMDMGQFHAYLKRYDSEYMFKELFGFEAKNSGSGLPEKGSENEKS